MGNYQIRTDRWPLKGHPVTVYSTNGVTVDGKYHEPGEFQIGQQRQQQNYNAPNIGPSNMNYYQAYNYNHQANYNANNFNGGNFNQPQPPSRGTDSEPLSDSDSDSYYLDSEINEDGVNYAQAGSNLHSHQQQHPNRPRN